MSITTRRQSARTMFIFLLTLISYRATMANNISEITRGRIIGLWEAGENINDIALCIECSTNCVRKCIKRWQEEGEKGLKDKRKDNHGLRFTTVEQDETLISCR